MTRAGHTLSRQSPKCFEDAGLRDDRAKADTVQPLWACEAGSHPGHGAGVERTDMGPEARKALAACVFLPSRHPLSGA